MLMTFGALLHRYDLKIDGVLHVGAHLAEEADTYAQAGIDRVWWVEANPAVYDYLHSKLQQHPGHELIEALVYSVDGMTLPFNVTNYDGMSSSIYEFGTHTQFSPDTVFERTLELPTITIDTLATARDIKANFLNMDLQGAELHALIGAIDFLEGVDYIMTEVNNAEVYQGCAQIGQIDEFLERDFERVETYWVDDQGWGDALYVRTA